MIGKTEWRTKRVMYYQCGLVKMEHAKNCVVFFIREWNIKTTIRELALYIMFLCLVVFCES